MNGLAVCGLVYLVYLFFSYLSHAFIFFDETCVTVYLMYPGTTSQAIYKLKLLHKLTTEHILHSRVKSSITQNRIVVFLKIIEL